LRFIIFISVFFLPLQVDYREVFEEHYDRAELFLDNISEKSAEIFKRTQEEQILLHSVVFPELIRFSIIMNYLETSSLELVYINTGLVDFSIGRFQIKPSFAEKVENYVLSDSINYPECYPIFKYASDDAIAIRRERVERLKSLDFQIYYLSAFYKIMLIKYPRLKSWKTEYKVRFLSTAYNHDFEAPKSRIDDFIDKNFYPWGIKKQSVKYNYSDISWFYFQDQYSD
jgi:hypothetical protein